jgi:hypothetical protein
MKISLAVQKSNISLAYNRQLALVRSISEKEQNPQVLRIREAANAKLEVLDAVIAQMNGNPVYMRILAGL